MGFEDFEPIYSELNAEWASGGSESGAAPPRRFLMIVSAPDYFHLKIQVTDFHVNSFESLQSVTQLEDLRDAIGIGGSWSDFVDYVVASIKLDARLVLDHRLNLGGAAKAKLVARKARGMPQVSISLIRAADSAANIIMENISFGLYNELKRMKDALASEKAQPLDYAKRSSAGKMLELSSPNKIDGKDSEDFTVKQESQRSPVIRAKKRVVPAFRRSKIRGAVIKDSD